MLGQAVGVHDRNHLIEYAVHDQYRLPDRFEIAEPLSGETLPFAKRCDLCLGDSRPRTRIEVVLTLSQPRDKRRAGRLASRAQGKKDLLQPSMALQRRVLEIARQTGLLDVHDVFAAPWGGAGEDQAPED